MWPDSNIHLAANVNFTINLKATAMFTLYTRLYLVFLDSISYFSTHILIHLIVTSSPSL